MRYLVLLLLAALLPCTGLAAIADALRPATARQPVVLFAKEGDKPVALELRAFQPFGAEPRIVLMQAGGTPRNVADGTRYYAVRGRDDPGLRGLLTLRADGRARGLLQLAGGLAWLHPEGAQELRIAPMAEPEPAQGFQCGNGDLGDPALSHGEAALLAGVRGTGLVPPQGYRARIAIETDDEFLALFGGDEQDAVAYVGSLMGFISSIYEEEVDTRMEVSFLRLWQQPAPYMQTTTSCALIETAKYWNDNEADVERTTMHFMSGRSTPKAGIAWVGVLCNGPSSFRPAQYGFSCPGIDGNVSSNYGGAYGVTMGLTAGFDAGNPQIGWDVMGVAHELGHNFNSPHTHCYGGIDGNPEPVDGCYNGEGGTGCWSGVASLPGAGPGTGTLMSYCHLRPGGLANTSLTLGTGHPFGVQPERVPTRMFDHVEGRAAGNAACLIEPVAQAALSVIATPDALTVGGTAALETEGGSGPGAVGFAITQGAASCAIAGETLTALALGVCEVTATKAGDALYLPATATTDVAVRALQAPLVIATDPSALVYGDAAQVQVSGGSGSGALTLALGPQSAACTLDGTTLQAVGIGACQIVASKAGDADYVAAETSLPLVVGRAPQAALLATASPPDIAHGASSTLSAQGGSGDGTVGFAVTAGGALCALEDNVLTAAASGTGVCTVTATRSGGSVHLPITATVDVGIFEPAVDLDLALVRLTPPPGETAGTHSYRVTVTNHGPVDAPGVRLQAAAVDGLTVAAWNCIAPHACDPATGSQAIDTRFDLAAGATLQLDLSGAVEAGERYVVLEAQVSPGAGISSLTPADDLRRLTDGIGERLFGDSFE